MRRLYFSEAVVEAVMPACFNGRVREAFEFGVGTNILARAASNGMTYCNVAGKVTPLILLVDDQAIGGIVRVELLPPEMSIEFESVLIERRGREGIGDWVKLHGLPDRYSICDGCKGSGCEACQKTGIVCSS